MMPEIFSPSPVSVTTPTMMPAVAVVAVTASTARPPVSSAVTSRFGQSAVSRRAKLSTTASIVARNTARNGVIPDNSSATIAMSGRKW